MRSIPLHRRPLLRLGVLCLAGLATACGPRTTANLTPELEQRFANETVLRQANDQTFRYTEKNSSGSNSWENRAASIIVTKKTVYLHKNEKVGIEIDSGGHNDAWEVHKDGERVLISHGSGLNKVTWSFAPPTDPAGWTTDIRAVIKGE